MSDLRGGHEAGHPEPTIIAGASVREQVKGYLVVSFTENLFLFPGGAPDVAGHHMTESLEIADVKFVKLRGRRTVPGVLSYGSWYIYLIPPSNFTVELSLAKWSWPIKIKYLAAGPNSWRTSK